MRDAKRWTNCRHKTFWLILNLLIVGCASSQLETQQQLQHQKYQTLRAEAKAKDDETRAKYMAIAKQLEEAASATKVFENALRTKEAVNVYSKNIDRLLNVISNAENDPWLQSPQTWVWPYVGASLKYARESAASAFITKGNAQLAMKDFDGARNTLRSVVVAFNPNVYGVYTRQAEFLLQDVEKAEAASRNQIDR